MNWCQKHWDDLRTALDRKGLTEFIADSEEEAARRMAAFSAEEGDPKDSFDPLFMCHIRVNTRMMEDIGMFMECPLCILLRDNDQSKVDNWLDGVTTEAWMYARDIGLIKEDG